jgi:hypothetical protein
MSTLDRVGWMCESHPTHLGDPVAPFLGPPTSWRPLRCASCPQGPSLHPRPTRAGRGLLRPLGLGGPTALLRCPPPRPQAPSQRPGL